MQEPWPAASYKAAVVRGVFNFIDSLVLGMQTLTYSASFYEDDEAEETKTDKLLNKVTKGNAEKVFMGFTVAFSIVLAVAIFIALPYGISLLFHSYCQELLLFSPFWEAWCVLPFSWHMWPLSLP